METVYLVGGACACKGSDMAARIGVEWAGGAKILLTCYTSIAKFPALYLLPNFFSFYLSMHLTGFQGDVPKLVRQGLLFKRSSTQIGSRSR